MKHPLNTRPVGPLDFFWRTDALSAPPSMGDTLTAFAIAALSLLPLEPVLTGQASAGLLALSAFALVLASLIPARVSVSDEGLKLHGLWRTNKLIPWSRLASVKRVETPAKLIRWLGPARLVLRVRWGRTLELPASSPAFARFEALAPRHAPHLMPR